MTSPTPPERSGKPDTEGPLKLGTRARAAARSRALGVAAVIAVMGTVAAVREPATTVAAPTVGRPASPLVDPTLGDPLRRGLDAAELGGTQLGLDDPALPAPGTSAWGVELGELVGDEYRLRVYARDDEMVYTVLDRDGDMLFEGIPGDELYRVVPGLDVRGLSADGAATIMLAPEPR